MAHSTVATRLATNVVANDPHLLSSNQSAVDPRPAIERFMREHEAGPVGLARYAPEAWAQANACLANVLTMVERAGGRAAFGWTFAPRFSPQHGSYLVATNHVVWHSPVDGALVDITPLHQEAGHHPIRFGGDTVFLVDAGACPQRVGRALTLLPLAFVAITPAPCMEAYLAGLTTSERQQWQEQIDREVREAK